jgi:hypothetical protein
MTLMQRLVLVTLEFNILIKAEHISGCVNWLLIHTKTNPTALYRLKIFGFLQLHQEFKWLFESQKLIKGGEDIYFSYQFCKSATNLPSESYTKIFINVPYRLMWSAFYSLRWNEAITISVFQFVKENIKILRS